MKTLNFGGLAGTAGLAVALVLLGAGAPPCYAQETGSAKGGASRLLTRPAPAVSAPAVATPATPACAKCQDVWVTRPDTEPKGAGAKALRTQGPLMVTTARHLCAGCETTLAVAGHGKAKETLLTHRCSECGAKGAGCCVR